jgi:hypothetical protein
MDEVLNPDELDQSQQALGKALDRARAGEDKELAVRVRELGEHVVRQLFGLLRMTRTHELDNQAFDKPIHDLLSTLTHLFDLLGAIHIVCVEDQVYVNDLRVRMDARADAGALLSGELRRHAVGGISFHDVPAEPLLRAMVSAFAHPPAEGTPRQALKDALTAAGLTAVELFGVFRFRVSGESTAAPTTTSTRKVAGRATGLVEATMDALGADRMPNPLPLRRVVTEILEVGPGAEGLWDQLDRGSPFSAHTTRVALLSMLIGRAAGLSDEALQDLGVAAMFHDVGYAAREGALPARGDDPGHPGFAPPFERHGTAGARLLLRQRGFHQAKIRRALATLQHHRDYNDPQGKPSLFARILRIAEDYDTLLRREGGGYAPHEILPLMAPQSGTAYDPVLLQLLINTLGDWPPGSRVFTFDGRIVRTEGLVRDPERFSAPMGVVVRDIEGQVPEERQVVDLFEEGILGPA